MTLDKTTSALIEEVNSQALPDRLRHVLWIGGSPGAGKTSAARWLSERYDCQVYHFDRHEPDHIARHDPVRQSALHAFLAMDMDERWVLRSPQEMAENTIRSWTQRFELVLEDLLALPSNSLVVAEGPGLFPDCVAPLLCSSHQAVWLTPDPLLLLRVRTLRGAVVAFETRNAPRAFRNIIRRDVLMAAHVERRCKELQLPMHRVEDDEPLHETIALVERHFAPVLRS